MPTDTGKGPSVNTTGHEWDGIKEYDNPLPRWWLYVFYATVVWSIGYYVLYPAIPWFTGHSTGTLNHTERTRGCFSSTVSCSIFSRLVLPLPQGPNTPTVRGVSASRMILLSVGQKSSK